MLRISLLSANLSNALSNSDVLDFFLLWTLIPWPPQEQGPVKTCTGLSHRHGQDWTHFLPWNSASSYSQFQSDTTLAPAPQPWHCQARCLRSFTPIMEGLWNSLPSNGLVLFSSLYLYCYFLSLILQDLGFCKRHFLFLNCLSLFLCPANSHLSSLSLLRALPGLAGHPLHSVSPLSLHHMSVLTVSPPAAAKLFWSPKASLPSTHVASSGAHGMNECLGKEASE